tara:strand:- start:1790 stop:2086 length:297 start_codon:yes stop_codon:yes gene_type:complete
MFFKSKTCIKEYLVSEINPWPKGCPKSQSNIAIKQASQIDNLESRFLTYVNDIKQFDIDIKKEETVNKKLRNEVKTEVNKTNNEAKNAEKAADKIKFK